MSNKGARKRNAVLCVVVATITACVANVTTSTQEQPSVIFINGTATLAGSGWGSNLGTYQIGMMSAMHMFTIGPQTPSDDDVLEAITEVNAGACADFTIDAQMLPGYEVCGANVADAGAPTNMTFKNCSPYNFYASFKPMSQGMQSCALHIDSHQFTSGVSNPTVNLTLAGSGMAIPYAMTADPAPPASLDFGNVPAGIATSALTMTVTNVGGQGLDIVETFSGATATYNFNPSLAPIHLSANAGSGSRQDYAVTCTPAAGAHDASVTFTTGAAQSNLSKTVNIHCTGIATSLQVTPPLDFGTLMHGDSTKTIAIDIKNTGGSIANITNIALTSGANQDVTFDAAQTSFMINPGATHTMAASVHYTGAHEQAYGPLGSLAITQTGVSPDLTLPISGGAHTGSIGASPGSVDLGTICAGSAASTDVNVYANGTADVQVDLETPPDAPFTASFQSTLLHGGHNGDATLHVAAMPGAGDVGKLSSKVVLQTNIPNDNNFPLDVTATAVPAGIAATPDTVDFHAVQTNTTTPGQTVVFSNCGAGGSLNVTMAQIVGADADSFFIAAPAQADIPQPIGDAESESFLVVMSPRSAGIKHATLQISYTGGPSPTMDVPLLGEGTEPQVDRRTYYACSVTGGMAGAWPIGLALLALRRRRR